MRLMHGIMKNIRGSAQPAQEVFRCHAMRKLTFDIGEKLRLTPPFLFTYCLGTVWMSQQLHGIYLTPLAPSFMT